MRLSTSLSLLCLFALPAAADPADRPVGLGVGVGVATGPNLQVMTTEHTHIDVGVGYQLDDHLRVQTDYGWRLASLASSRSINLPLYLGIGGFVSDHPGVTDGGLRMPLGLQADFTRAPLEVFGELAPELIVIQMNDHVMAGPPASALALTGLMGVRAAF
jgi:hypothetical protein